MNTQADLAPLAAKAARVWPDMNGEAFARELKHADLDQARAVLNDIRKRGATWTPAEHRATLRRITGHTDDEQHEPAPTLTADTGNTALLMEGLRRVKNGADPNTVKAELRKAGALAGPSESDRRAWTACRNTECDAGWIYTTTTGPGGAEYSAVDGCPDCAQGKHHRDTIRRRRVA